MTGIVVGAIVATGLGGGYVALSQSDSSHSSSTKTANSQSHRKSKSSNHTQTNKSSIVTSSSSAVSNSASSSIASSSSRQDPANTEQSALKTTDKPLPKSSSYFTGQGVWATIYGKPVICHILAITESSLIVEWDGNNYAVPLV